MSILGVLSIGVAILIGWHCVVDFLTLLAYLGPHGEFVVVIVIIILVIVVVVVIVCLVWIVVLIVVRKLVIVLKLVSFSRMQ